MNLPPHFITWLKAELYIYAPLVTYTKWKNDKASMTSYVRKLFMWARRLNKIVKLSAKIEDITKHKLARKEAMKTWKVAKRTNRTSLVQDLSKTTNQKT